MLRIQLINKNMRLVGVTEEMFGKYVIADDWSVVEVIGESWKGVAQSIKMKAIRIDYINKTIVTSYDFKEEMFKNIIKGEKYDKNVGNHWGGEMVIRLVGSNHVLKIDNPDPKNPFEFAWFLCTPATRELLKPVNEHLGKVMVVTSTLVDARSFQFHNPVITFGE